MNCGHNQFLLVTGWDVTLVVGDHPGDVLFVDTAFRHNSVQYGLLHVMIIFALWLITGVGTAGFRAKDLPADVWIFVVTKIKPIWPRLLLVGVIGLWSRGGRQYASRPRFI